MQRIGLYEVQEEIGRGGMGVVYRAVDPKIGRLVAVKVIRLGDLSDPEEEEQLRGRLFREARAAGVLKHGGIVTIYYVGEEHGLAFIAMEYVNGPTLEKLLLADIPLDKERIRQILRETAAALDYAHKRGIVHRDVKPANVMLEDNETVKVCDFGIAKGFTGLSSITQAGMAIGTPHYMPPEQIQGKVVDGRADQYALAVIAFQMLTGRRPFQADSIQTLFYRIMAEPPEAAHKLNPSLPTAVDEVFAKALAKEPGNRYASCREFAAELLSKCDSSPDWIPLARRGAAGPGSAPIPEPVPPPPQPVAAVPPASVGRAEELQSQPERVERFAPAPAIQLQPVSPPEAAENRCGNCGGVAQPGVELCPSCASSAASAAPSQPVAVASVPGEPQAPGQGGAEAGGPAAGGRDSSTELGLTPAFAEVWRATEHPQGLEPRQVVAVPNFPREYIPEKRGPEPPKFTGHLLPETRKTRSSGRRWRPLVVTGLGGAAIAVCFAIWATLPKPNAADSLSVSPSELTFRYQKAGPSPMPQKVALRMQRSERVWRIEKSRGWVSVSADRGNGPADVEFRVDPGGLNAGEYDDTVWVTSGPLRSGLRVHLAVIQPATTEAEFKPSASRRNVAFNVEPRSLLFSQSSSAQPCPSQKLRVTADSTEAWKLSPADPWIVAGQSSGRGSASVSIGVDALRLSPGSYSSFVTATAPSGVEQVRVSLIVHAVETSQESGRASHNVAALQNPRETQPATQGQAPVSPQLPDLPAVSCTTGYAGNLAGVIRWTGELPPNAVASIGRQNATTLGSARGNPLPGCEVSVGSPTPGVDIVEKPSGSNNYGRLKFRNSSGNPLTSIVVKWEVK